MSLLSVAEVIDQISDMPGGYLNLSVFVVDGQPPIYGHHYHAENFKIESLAFGDPSLTTNPDGPGLQYEFVISTFKVSIIYVSLDSFHICNRQYSYTYT